MTIKVLKLDFWMKYDFTRNDEKLTTCEPIFNRDGYYYNSVTKECWFEVDGDAFEYSSDGFLYQLDKLNFRPLLQTERDAIKILQRSGLATQQQIQMLTKDDFHREMRYDKWKLKVKKKEVLKNLKERMKNIFTF